MNTNSNNGITAKTPRVNCLTVMYVSDLVGVLMYTGIYCKQTNCRVAVNPFKLYSILLYSHMPHTTCNNYKSTHSRGFNMCNIYVTLTSDHEL